MSMVEGVNRMAEKATKKAPAKKATAKKVSALEALQKAIADARKAGVLVKGFATHTTEEGTDTIRL